MTERKSGPAFSEVEGSSVVAVMSRTEQHARTYAVTHGNTCVLTPSPIGMKLGDGTMLGTKPVVKSAKTRSVNQSVKAPFYKRAEIPEVYEELTLTLKGNYKVVFRAYDEGVAYRFVTDFKKNIIVENEDIAKRCIRFLCRGYM